MNQSRALKADSALSRRGFFRSGVLGGAGVAAATLIGGSALSAASAPAAPPSVKPFELDEITIRAL
ncbi:MAG TPA: hypothetical protein VKM93_07680, partial [Terriglobia bacterium]|nr:hypothetical protein [Terriglobia bacterium]